MLLTDAQEAFVDMLYSEYQKMAYSILPCTDPEYSASMATELRLKIDQLSHCNVFKCNNPE